MTLNQRNSKKQGDVGLGMAIGWFCANGYTVSLPLTDSQEYDLIVDDGDLQRIQVKTSRHKAPSGSWKVDLRTNGGNMTGAGKTTWIDKSKVDYLFIVTGDGSMYYLPVTLLDEKSNSLTIGNKYKEYQVSSDWV